MVNYRAPGVYVQEVPSGTRMFGQAGTSSAGFVGVAPDPKAPRDTVETIDNWSQFVRIFIGAATEGTHLSTAVYGYFANGGSRAYVVNVGKGGSLTGTAAAPTGLTLLEAIDDVSIVVAPGFTDPDDYDKLIAHCQDQLRQDRMAILDTVEDVDDVGRLLEVGTTGVPTRPATSAATSTATGSDDAAAPTTAAAPASRGLRPPNSPDGYAALYYPWLVVTDPVSGVKVTTPPSGHIAGVWLAPTRPAESTRRQPIPASRGRSTWSAGSARAIRNC